MAISLTVTFAPTLPDGTNLTSPTDFITVPFVLAAAKGTKYDKLIATSDGTFDLGQTTTIGYVRVRNLAQSLVPLTPPDAPVITEGGTPASTTRDYKIVALQSDGTYAAASAAGISTTGAAALNGTDFETITWVAVPGAASYDVYRTVAGGTPSTVGKIGNTMGITLNDTGLAGDTNTPPSVAADNLLLLGHTSGTYVLSLNGGEVAVFRWNSAALHHKANTRAIPVDITILDN